MKTLSTAKPLVLTFIMLVCMYVNTRAQVTLIHYWNFNSLVLPSSGPSSGHLGPYKIPADYSLLSSLNPSVAFKSISSSVKADTGYVDTYTGDTINARMGAAAGNAIRTRNPSDSMQLVWVIPTTGYQNIVIKYETEASSTTSGQHRQNFDYSIDGTNFITTGLPIAYDSAGTSWGKVTLDLTAITTINNNPNFIFRIRFGIPNTGTSGNNRFDNVTVEGITYTPSGIKSSSIPTDSYSLYPNPVTDNLYVKGINQVKSWAITNILGQEVSVSSGWENGLLSVNTNSLSNGLYFIRIVETSGDIVTLKFIKK